jgi:hypothetical protein
MFIVRLLGGLGNQIFQYCYGQRLQYEHCVPVYYDTRLLQDHSQGRHAVNRQYALDIFEANVQRDPLRAIRYSADGYPRIVRGLLRMARITRPEYQIIEKNFEFDPSYLRITSPAYFAGLWQSTAYISPIESQLRDSLQFRSPLASVSRSLAQDLAAPGSVCIHVRRTDYLTHQNSGSPLQFVGIDYYRNAIKRLTEFESGLRFFVFSDDLEWCRRELPFIANPTFVTSEHAGFKDSGHLRLMSLAHRFVIPNSTFSWWAAWLGKQADKQVYMPSHWFRDSCIDASGLYPNGWHVVPVA